MTDNIIWRLEHIESGKGPIEHLVNSGQLKKMMPHYVSHAHPGDGDADSKLDIKWKEILEGQNGKAYGPKSLPWFFG